MPTPLPDTSTTSSTIDEIVDKYADELVELRRDLHAHPELSWGEHRTTDAVAERLEAAGITVTRLRDTGLLADIGDTGSLVGLRADLDALPVDDTTDLPWSSTTPGVAHACGHDVHTAGLVGAGLALAEAHQRGQLAGRVRLLFQPAEEVMPGGALKLMDQGALEGLERIFMLHCDPSLDVGPRRPARRGPHRCRGRALGAAHRARRPHLASPPHRGPHLRARQAGRRAPRHPVPPARPPCRGERRLGRGPGRLRPQRDPRRVATRPARSGCSTRSRGPTPRRWCGC